MYSVFENKLKRRKNKDLISDSFLSDLVPYSLMFVCRSNLPEFAVFCCFFNSYSIFVNIVSLWSLCNLGPILNAYFQLLENRFKLLWILEQNIFK